MVRTFKRSDGIEFVTAEDSAEYKLMSQDGSFEEIDELTETTPETNQNDPAPAPKQKGGRRKKAEETN